METQPLLRSSSEVPARRRGAWVAVAGVAAAGAACVLLTGGVVLRGGGVDRWGRAGLLQRQAAQDSVHKIMDQKMGTAEARIALDSYFDREGDAQKRQHAAAEGATADKASQRTAALNRENAHTWRFQDDGKAGEEDKEKGEDKFEPSFDDLVTRRMNHADKVKIGFYMESECPGCRIFGRQVLAKWMAVPEFNNMVSLEVVPYGNGKLEGDQIACQHGPEECVGNMVIACMQRHRPISDTDKLGFLTGFKCLMESEQPPELVFPHCTSEGKMEYDKVRECVYGEEGRKLVLEAARATESLVPELEFSPWITINGKPCREAAWKDLLPTVCEEYKGPKGKLCQDLASGDAPAAPEEGGAEDDAPEDDEAAKGGHAALLRQRGQASVPSEGFTVCERGTGAEVPMPA